MAKGGALPVEGNFDMLFVAYSGGHSSMMVPAAQALATQGVHVRLFARIPALPHAKATGLPWFSYADLPQARDTLTQGYGHKIAPLMLTRGELSALKLSRIMDARLRAIVVNDPIPELAITQHSSQSQEAVDDPNVFESPNTEPLDLLMHSVDVVVETVPTVGVQGHLMGCSVPRVECSAVSPNVPYGAFRISRAITKLDDISSNLRRGVSGDCSLSVKAFPIVVAEIKRHFCGDVA